MSICPPNKGPLAESSGYNKLVKDIQGKYNVSEETAKGLADFSFFSKGDLPGFEEASGIIDKSIVFQEIKPIKEQIKDLFNKIIRRKPEDVGYRMGLAEGKVKTKEAEAAGAQKVKSLKEQIKADKQAYKESRKEFASRLSEYLKTNDKLRTRLSERQVDAIARRANAIGVSEKSYNKFVKYFEKVISAKDYEADLKLGSKLKGDLKLSLADSAGFVNRMKSLDIERLSPEDLKKYNQLAEDYMNSLKSPVSPDYKPFEREPSEFGLNKLEEIVHNDIIKETEQKFDIEGLTKEEADFVNEYMNSENKDEFEQKLKEDEKIRLRDYLYNMTKYSQMSLSDWIEDNKDKLLSYFGKNITNNFDILANSDMSKVTDLKDLAYITRVIDNSITNNTIANISQVANTVKAYDNVNTLIEATKGLVFGEMGQYGAKDKYQKESLRAKFEDTPILLQALLGDSKAIGKLRELTGYRDMVLAKSKADDATIKLKKSYEKFIKSNKFDNSAEFDITTGIHSSLLDVRSGYENVDFLHEKGQLEKSIERLSKSNKTEDQETAKILSNYYEQNVKDKNTYNEYVDGIKKNLTDIHLTAVWMANEFAKIREQYSQFSLSSEGKQGDFSSRRYYSPKKYYTVTERPSSAMSPDDASYSTQTSAAQETGRNMERELKNGELGDEKVVDYRFMYKSAKAYQDVMFEMGSYDAKQMHSKMSKIEGYDEIFGGKENAEFFNDMYDTQYAHARRGRINSDALSNLYAVKILRTMKNVGAPAALARFSQYISQRAVLFNTWRQSGKYFRDVVNQYTKETFGLKKLDNIELLKESTVGYRETEMGSLGTTETAETTGYNKLKRGANKLVDDAYLATGSLRDIAMQPLIKGDVRSAEISFLSYYLKYMNEAGVKTTAKDLATEHLRMDQLRREAISYAEQKVDATQGVSNKIQQAKLKVNAEGGFTQEFVKSVIFPFNNFASNTKTRLIEDIYQIKNGNKEQAKQARIDLSGTLVETVAFQAANAFLISGIERYGIRYGLGKLFGLDPEKDNVYEYTSKQLQKFYTGVTREILFSGFGGEAEQLGMSALNRFVYWVANKSNKESGKDYYDWLKKDAVFTPQYETPANNVVLNVANNLGSYGIAVRNAYQIKQEAQAAYTGIGESEYEFKKESSKKMKDVTTSFDITTRKQLNMNERHFATFMAMWHGLSVIGLSEQDIARASESKERDIFRGKKVAKR